jgi:hypothetical protein
MDLLTPLPLLAPTRAPYIENFFINGQSLQVRNGSRIWSTISGASSTTEVPHLVTYNAADGTQKLFGFALPSNRIYDYSTSSATVVYGPAAFSEFGSFIKFRSYIYYYDGVNTGARYDGATWSSFSGFTGPVSAASFIAGNPYKSRLYLVENNTATVWYGGVNSVTGAMTSFDVSSLFRLGGFLLNVFPVSFSSTAEAQNYLAFVSSQGEVLVYAGDNPGAANWQIVTQFVIGKPINRKAFLLFQGDALICTDTGLASLREMLQTGSNNGLYVTISRPVDLYWRYLCQGALTTAAEREKVCIEFLPKTGCIYISFPQSLSRGQGNVISADNLSSIPVIFVFNTNTGGWTLYYIGITPQKRSFAVFQNRLIAATNKNAHVIEIERSGVFNDESVVTPGSYEFVNALVLSGAISNQATAGHVTKINGLNVFSYLNYGNLGGAVPIICNFIENFGRAISGFAGPSAADNSYNNTPINLGSVADYVQYQLQVRINSNSGFPSVLYAINGLVEKGGYR